MFRPTTPAATSTMAISTSPRKVIPLNTGDDWEPRPRAASSGPTVTRRAFFCGVVVEGPSDGMDLSEDVQELVASLGDRVCSGRSVEEAIQVQPTGSEMGEPQTRARAMANTSALSDLINELVTTERTYVQRLRILKDSYADPLRSYARSKDTAIIPAYEAKILFGNIDQLVPANEALLHDLEQMIAPDGAQTVGGIGDVLLYHFKDLKAFECYKQYYSKREEAQAIFRREMTKKSSTGFAAFVERIKYSTNDGKNRVGLRELLMEPVQRIPRYTLLFRQMVKLMAPGDPQRLKLKEADEIASRIALAETDDHTRNAATLSCLAASIEGFPPGLISSSRRFVDILDVDDHFVDSFGSTPYGNVASTLSSVSSGASGGGGSGSLHCSLILFDDKLMIVKRPSSEKAGRTLAGLDEVEKLANGGLATTTRGRGLSISMKRAGMTCKGVVDITDVAITDCSGPDAHLFLENPPLDQTDRWAGRPFRSLSSVVPSQDPVKAEREKKRFIENLWNAQVLYRAKAGQSVALCADEREIESKAGKITIARTYFNVYQRTTFLQEAKKTKIVLHIDSLGNADPLRLLAPPYVVVRVQPLPGELCRYTVYSSDPDDEPEDDVFPTVRVPIRIVHTIHQYGLFKFRTNNPSRPATPSGSHRSRAHIFGLDVISRNLFGTSRSKDSFGSGSIGSHKRSKSAMSRVNTVRTDLTGTTSTTSDSSMKFSSRSTSTAATSVSSFAADEDSFTSSRSASKSRKLVKRNRSRSRSPGAALAYGSESEPEFTSSRTRSRSMSQAEESLDYSDHEDVSMTFRDTRAVSQSEMDLKMRLELARRNSKNQHGRVLPSTPLDMPVEETIYEEEPPLPTRPASRMSYASRSTTERDGLSIRSPSPNLTNRSVTPTQISQSQSQYRGRPESVHSRERRPIGPRAPSPLPPTSPTMHAIQLDIDGALESTLAQMSPQRPRTPIHLPQISDDSYSNSMPPETPSQLPRSRRHPFIPSGNTDITPKNTNVSNTASKTVNGIEPLSIKKKTSNATPASIRRSYGKDSPLAKRSTKMADKESPPMSIRKLEPIVTGSELNGRTSSELSRSLLQFSETTKEDLESSQRAVKRIKLEVQSLPDRLVREKAIDRDHRPTTPLGGLSRTPTRILAASQEANARMEEMRALIGHRKPVTPRARPKSVIESSGSQGSISTTGSGSLDISEVQDAVKSLGEIVASAESDITRATENHEALEKTLVQFVSEYDQQSSTLEKTRTELRSTRRQCELVKNLLADATAENEIMYESFNEELDGMFNDANLPLDEAWQAMSSDLSKTKEDRNRLAQENSQLKRSLQQIELERDEWAALLRKHGLIP